MVWTSQRVISSSLQANTPKKCFVWTNCNGSDSSRKCERREKVEEPAAAGAVLAAGCVLFVFPAYSGVNGRPAVSARLCCHNASRLPLPDIPSPSLRPFSATSPLYISSCAVEKKKHQHLIAYPGPRPGQRSQPRWPPVDPQLDRHRLSHLSAAKSPDYPITQSLVLSRQSWSR